ncbi:long-chain-fatty-acid-CoA-ligase [Gymnopilus junonius]|uniref:Long-chain-fatty-acid-CoA-ligase n=1 Tax=Gymnopilus junonius TaxID=109634 RepID=A0A9P5TH33_GYMJU|nr:long-chain-fatty-acid-CoA-ligase [Gymnopilus junonius]
MNKAARPKGYFGKGTVEVAPPERPGEGGIRRLEVEKDALVTEPVPGVSTIPDIISYAAQEHGQKRALGWRDVTNIHEEKKQTEKVVDGRETTETKTWKYFELSDYHYMDYSQFRDAISEIARALVDFGIGSDDVFDIFAQTRCSQLATISNACALISTTITTAYETLGESGLAHSLNEPKCVAIFTNSEHLPTVLKVLPTCPQYFDPRQIQSIRKTNSTSYAAAASGGQTSSIRAVHIDKLRSIGRDLPLSILTSRLPTPDTRACIMYTSGSTGDPKGVILTHGNLVAAVAAYVVELCAVFVGIACGYARPKTLTDDNMRNCVGDLRALRPNVMFGVPAVWETIRKAIVSQVDSGGSLVKNLFNLVIGVKKFAGGRVPVLDWAIDIVVLSRIKETVGGDIHFAVNGGAGISRDTQEFFNLAVMPLTQGYGLTETCGMGAFLPPDLLSPSTYGTAGVPGPSLEIKLIDCPEMGYFSNPEAQDGSGFSDSVGGVSTSNSSHLPQGEICLRGTSLTKGYFNRPDLNADEEIFTKNGWFRTGDIGQWNVDGTLSVIDRKKNLVKLKTGEYIAIERLETIYGSSEFVSNICIYATSTMRQPLAIIIPREKNLRNAVESSSSMDLSQICADKAARGLVLYDLTQLAKKNGFARMEVPSDVILTAQEWTSKNGLVTAAGKVNRAKIEDEFRKEIEKYQK